MICEFIKFLAFCTRRLSELCFMSPLLDGVLSFLNFLDIYLFLCQPVEEPEKMTQIIVEALEITKQRGIINKGWGGLGNCKSYLPF